MQLTKPQSSSIHHITHSRTPSELPSLRNTMDSFPTIMLDSKVTKDSDESFKDSDGGDGDPTTGCCVA